MRGTSMSTPIADWSRERRDEKNLQQPRLAAGRAGDDSRAVLGAPADDDRRQLFGSGRDGGEPFLLERRYMVPRTSRPGYRYWQPFLGRSRTKSDLLVRRSPDRGAARRRSLARAAAARLGRRAESGADRASHA